MKANGYERFICLLFAVFIGGWMLAFCISPKRSFSETENRTLAQAPELSLSAVADGSYMKKLETYIADQFPLRDQWVELKSASEYVLGLREFNGIYLCGDRLIAKVEEPDQEQLERNLGYVQKLAENSGRPVYFALIPTAAEIWKDRLPAGSVSYDQAALIRSTQQGSTSFVDILGQLECHSGEEIFYRTDHHWTSLGAYYGYRAVMEAMGREPKPISEYSPRTVSRAFNGTLYSTSGIHWLAPDHIETYVSDTGVSVISYEGAGEMPGAMYHEEYLNKKDKYSYFMGGNQPMVFLKNPAAEGGSLLVIRDSYMDSLLPFLSQEFSEICAIDLRYYHASVYQLLQGYDQVLVCYGTANFLTERNLVFLTQ